MLGRPSLLYFFSKVGESALKAASAISFTRRRGWSSGTRSPGVLRVKIVSYCFFCPRSSASQRERHAPILLWIPQPPFFNTLLALSVKQSGGNRRPWRHAVPSHCAPQQADGG